MISARLFQNIASGTTKTGDAASNTPGAPIIWSRREIGSRQSQLELARRFLDHPCTLKCGRVCMVEDDSHRTACGERRPQYVETLDVKVVGDRDRPVTFPPGRARLRA